MTNLTVPEDIEWLEGPPMAEGRLNHECGRIRKSSNNSDEYSIVVVGGSADKQSVEIYDINNNSWQSGPALPSKIINLIFKKIAIMLKFK